MIHDAVFHRQTTGTGADIACQHTQIAMMTGRGSSIIVNHQVPYRQILYLSKQAHIILRRISGWCQTIDPVALSVQDIGFSADWLPVHTGQINIRRQIVISTGFHCRQFLSRGNGSSRRIRFTDLVHQRSGRGECFQRCSRLCQKTIFPYFRHISTQFTDKPRSALRRQVYLSGDKLPLGHNGQFIGHSIQKAELSALCNRVHRKNRGQQPKNKQHAQQPFFHNIPSLHHANPNKKVSSTAEMQQHPPSFPCFISYHLSIIIYFNRILQSFQGQL